VFATDASNNVLHSLSASGVDALQPFDRTKLAPVNASSKSALWGVTASSKVAGTIFVADRYGYRVLSVVVATGATKVIAGTGSKGNSGDGGPATAATLEPHLITIDALGRNLFVSDITAGAIRIIDLVGGTIASVTLAGAQAAVAVGTGAKAVDTVLTGVTGVVTVPGGADNTTLYLPTTLSTVASVDANGAIVTFAGVATALKAPVAAGDGAAATAATLATVAGVAVAPGGRQVFIAGGTDPFKSTVRVVTNKTTAVPVITTLVTSGGPGAGGSLPSKIAGIVASSTTLYILGFNVPNVNSLSPTSAPTPTATRGAATPTASATVSASRVLASPSANVTGMASGTGTRAVSPSVSTNPSSSVFPSGLLPPSANATSSISASASLVIDSPSVTATASVSASVTRSSSRSSSISPRKYKNETKHKERSRNRSKSPPKKIETKRY
jgi:hypothetical protein